MLGQQTNPPLNKTKLPVQICLLIGMNGFSARPSGIDAAPAPARPKALRASDTEHHAHQHQAAQHIERKQTAPTGLPGVRRSAILRVG